MTYISGLGTATPRFELSQEQVGRSICDYLELGSNERRVAERVFRRTCVETRRTVLEEFSGFYRPGEAPSLSSRMTVFEREAPDLAASAAREALEQAGLCADEIDHLIVVTCTGVYTPGLDVDLVRLLKMRESVGRTLISMMGCSGAFSGLRVAKSIAESGPKRRVLLVAAEISTIHLDRSADLADFVAYALFGDGAAATVVESHPRESPLVKLGLDRSGVYPDAGHVMRWNVDEDGFHVSLSSDLPEQVGGRLPVFIAPLLEDRPEFWVVHPGGPAVLREVGGVLGLRKESIASSWAVLRTFGNLSSATVLFVLAKELAQGVRKSHAQGLMLGFGPGLTLEALQISWP